MFCIRVKIVHTDRILGKEVVCINWLRRNWERGKAQIEKEIPPWCVAIVEEIHVDQDLLHCYPSEKLVRFLCQSCTMSEHACSLWLRVYYTHKYLKLFIYLGVILGGEVMVKWECWSGAPVVVLGGGDFFPEWFLLHPRFR